MSYYALECKKIVKRFGGVVALDEADFSVQYGDIHFLLGSNGSGKSTLCKVIVGSLSFDAGSIILDGEQKSLYSPKLAVEYGIGVAYQELSLIPELTVRENILLGMEKTKRGIFIDIDASDEILAITFDKFKTLFSKHVSLDTILGELTIGQQQLVEIMKLLAKKPKILIFDESTASLSRHEIALFFNILKILKQEGKAIICITHKMNEIFEIGDSVSVMKNGKIVTTNKVNEVDKKSLILSMAGKNISTNNSRRTQKKFTKTILNVKNFKTSKIDSTSFELYEGEVLGLGGLQGQGQTDLLLGLFGVDYIEDGSLTIDNEEFNTLSPIQAVKKSCAFISGDRKKLGIFSERDILENLTLAWLNARKKYYFRKNKLFKFTVKIIENLGIKISSLGDKITSLSGGNQQKVLIARWFLNDPRILFLDDPTKGVDVNSRMELSEMISSICEKGGAVVWYSSDDLELLENSDRILVFHEGAISGELKGELMTEQELYKSSLMVKE